eukprot:XP_013239114.1 uncharacterized protein DI09_144p20 [Mitosporidium daphniae]
MPDEFHFQSIAQLEASVQYSQLLAHKNKNSGAQEISSIENELRMWFDYFEDLLFPLHYESSQNKSYSPTLFLTAYKLLIRYVDILLEFMPYFLEPYASFRHHIDSLLKFPIAKFREDPTSVWRNSVISLHLLNIFKKAIRSSADKKNFIFKDSSISSIKVLPCKFALNFYLAEIEAHCRLFLNASPSIYSGEEVTSGEEIFSSLLEQIHDLFPEMVTSNLSFLCKPENISLHSFALQVFEENKTFPDLEYPKIGYVQFNLCFPKLVSTISLSKDVDCIKLELILLCIDFFIMASISTYQSYDSKASLQKEADARLLESLVRCTYISKLAQYLDTIIANLPRIELEALKRKNWNYSRECTRIFVISNAIHLNFLQDSTLIAHFYRQNLDNCNLFEYLFISIPSLRKIMSG